MAIYWSKGACHEGKGKVNAFEGKKGKYATEDRRYRRSVCGSSKYDRKIRDRIVHTIRFGEAGN